MSEFYLELLAWAILVSCFYAVLDFFLSVWDDSDDGF